MAGLNLVVDMYRCDPCSNKQGVEVTELVRMMPKAAIFNGQLVGTEYWCCPICFEKKFPVKQPKKPGEKREPARQAKRAVPTRKPRAGRSA